MHTPAIAQNLKDKKDNRIFLGIQGPAGSGKSTAALTFPNPIYLDIDGGLVGIANVARQLADKHVLHIPFYSDKYCVETGKCKTITYNGQSAVDKRWFIKKFLSDEGPKFTSDQTLILDSWSSLQNMFDRVEALEPSFTKKGAIDDYAPWNHKLEYSRDILDILKGLECHTIVIFHEYQDRDKETHQLNDKLLPLHRGQFLGQIKVPFTDFFRQRVIPKLDRMGKPVKVDGKDIDLPNDINYLWQIKSDDTFDAKTRMTRPEKYILATYESFTYNK